MAKRVRLLTSVTAYLQSDATERQDGWNPQTNEKPLLMAPREPQRD